MKLSNSSIRKTMNSFLRIYLQSILMHSAHKMEFISLVFASLLVFASTGPIPDNVHQHGLEQQTKQKKPITMDNVKNAIKEDFEGRVNTSEKDPDFKETMRLEQEDMTVDINFSNRFNFNGNKADVEITSNGTETNFTIRADVASYEMTEKFDIEVVGLINGKKVSEKGKITYKWEKVRLNFIFDVVEGSKKFENLLASATECVHPSIKTEGLSEDVVKKIENAISVHLKDSWKKFLGVETEKETKYGKSFNACKQQKWTTNA